MTPLTDLGSADYLGFAGGLYPNGKNSRPPDHDKVGVALGATVQPLDKGGKPSTSGKAVMICLGMSNASREFSHFIRLVNANPRKNPGLLMIDAARSKAHALEMAAPRSEYWTHVDRQLARHEISAAQIQVVWLKTALADQPCGFPEKMLLLQGALSSIVEILPGKFPQLKLVYLSSRTYGGYSKTNLSPEPLAYESAFAVKWLLEERINHPRADKSLPWLSWGPYLWADGTAPRRDGVTWEPGDFEPDGVHPSAQGAMKVAAMLFKFFKSDPSAKPWFLSQSH